TSTSKFTSLPSTEVVVMVTPRVWPPAVSSQRMEEPTSAGRSSGQVRSSGVWPTCSSRTAAASCATSSAGTPAASPPAPGASPPLSGAAPSDSGALLSPPPAPPSSAGPASPMLALNEQPAVRSSVSTPSPTPAATRFRFPARIRFPLLSSGGGIPQPRTWAPSRGFRVSVLRWRVPTPRPVGAHLRGRTSGATPPRSPPGGRLPAGGPDRGPRSRDLLRRDDDRRPGGGVPQDVHPLPVHGLDPLLGEHLGGGAVGDQPAGGEDQQPVGVARGQVEVVQHGHDAGALVAPLPGGGEQPLLVLQVE